MPRVPKEPLSQKIQDCRPEVSQLVASLQFRRGLNNQEVADLFQAIARDLRNA